MRAGGSWGEEEVDEGLGLDRRAGRRRLQARGRGRLGHGRAAEQPADPVGRRHVRLREVALPGLRLGGADAAGRARDLVVPVALLVLTGEARGLLARLVGLGRVRARNAGLERPGPGPALLLDRLRGTRLV